MLIIKIGLILLLLSLLGALGFAAYYLAILFKTNR